MITPTVTGSLAGAVPLLKALASPVRLLVVIELGGGPRCVHELLAALEAGGRPVSQPLMSQHLKVMRQAGVVRATRRAQEIVYELADSHIARIAADAIEHAGEVRSP